MFEIEDDKIDWAKHMVPPEERARVMKPSALRDAIHRISAGVDAAKWLKLPFLGDYFVSFPPGEVTIWTGLTHHGKTTALKQLLLYGALTGHKGCIASLEEKTENTLFDITCMATHSPRPSEDDCDVATNWLDGKLYLYDQRNMIQPERIVGVMNYAATELGVTQFAVDSWMCLDIDDEDNNRHKKVMDLLTMHADAKGVHVHLVVHMTKGDGKDTPQHVDKVRGSGNIINRSHRIINVWRNPKERYEREGTIESQPDGMLLVPKQRGIRPWNARPKIKLWMDPVSGQLVDKANAIPKVALHPDYIKRRTPKGGTEEMFV